MEKVTFDELPAFSELRGSEAEPVCVMAFHVTVTGMAAAEAEEAAAMAATKSRALSFILIT
jgi:hypothetical protein